MAEQIQKFRSSLSGFNREDVVQFIQAAAYRHEIEVNGLKDDNKRLQEACRQQEAETAALKEETAALRAALEEARAALTAAPQEAPRCPDWKEEELAAYRRAEEVERQSRQRAAQLHQEITGLIADASVKMDDANCALSDVMAQLNQDILKLRTAMDAGKAVLNDTSLSLRAVGSDGEE